MINKPQVYLLVGVPASGKSWVSEQLTSKFNYVQNDRYIGAVAQPLAYVAGIAESARTNPDKPVLAEAPFSISAIKGPLETRGFKVTTVFILEKNETIKARWHARPENRGKVFPVGHLTRQKTYSERAKESKSFSGTSSEVYEHLRGLEV